MKKSLFASPQVRFLFWLLLAIIALQIGFLEGGAVVYQANDPDSWLRLLQVRNLTESGDWHNKTIQKDNFPQGVATPWSRLADLVLWGLALLLSPFTASFNAALELAGAWLNPLMMAIGLAGLLGVVRYTAKSPLAQLYLLLAFLIHPFALQIYKHGVVDHHAVLFACFSLQLALLAAIFDAKDETRVSVLCRWLGVVAAIGIWASVEYLVQAGFVFAALGVQWLRGKHAVRHLGSALTVAALGVAMCVAIEHAPSDWLRVEHDALSIVQLSLMVFSALAVSVLEYCEGRLKNLQSRLLSAGLAFGAVLAAMQLLFPSFWKGPLAAVAPEMQQIFISRISELKPVYETNDIFLLAAWFAGLFMVPLMLRHGKTQTHFLLAAGVVLFSGMMLFYGRWYGYLTIVSLPVIALVLDSVFTARRPSPAVMALWALLAVGYPYIGAILSLQWGAPNKQPEHFELTCQYALSDALHADYPSAVIGDNPQLVLLDPNAAPELFYFTPHGALSWNTHRNREGYSAIYHFMRAADAHAAHEIAAKRKAALLMTCLPVAESETTYPFLASLQKQTSDWLEPVSDHPWTEQGLKIYKVLP